MKPLSLLPAIAAVLCLAACQHASSSPPVSILTLDASSPKPSSFDRTTDAHGATRVYHNTFESAPGDEWADKTVSKTPTGGRPYLGDFLPRKPVALSLKDLPPHELVRITFDLYVMGGWSGSSPDFGYHRWDLDLGDGRSLIHTTFSNWGGAYNNNNEQSFPDTYPARPHPSFTLAAENQSLGTMMNTQQANQFDASSVYHLVLTFPHNDKDIIFAFHSLVQEWQQKPFGLANVTVETLPAPPMHTQAELTQLWKDLGEMDPQKSFKAQWELIASGDQAVDFIAKHSEESIDPTLDDVRKMVDELEAADEEHRPAILEKLAFTGSLASAILRKAVAEDAIAEDVKQAVEKARVTSKRYNETPTQLRIQRTKHLLNAIHTKAALALNVLLPEPPARPISTD